MHNDDDGDDDGHDDDSDDDGNKDGKWERLASNLLALTSTTKLGLIHCFAAFSHHHPHHHPHHHHYHHD